MSNMLAALAGALISAVSLMPAALAQPACVTQNMVVPPGANTSDKAAPFFIDTTGLDFKTNAADARPVEPELSARDGAARRHAAAVRRRGEFHHRPDPRARARDRRQGRRAARHDHVVHVVLKGQRDLQPRPDPRRHAGLQQQFDHGDDDGAGRQVEHDRHHQPPRHLDAHDRGLCPAELCARHGGAVHRARRRRLDRLEGHEHHPRQSDPAAPRAADGLHPDRQWRAGRAGRPARARIRHGVGDLCAVRRARGVAARRAARRREADEGPRRPRDHGAELERHRGLHHGVVPSRALSSGAGLFADHGQPAMAVESGAARRRLGISQRRGRARPVPTSP